MNIQGKRVDLNIWDTAGQERFHALGPIYYRDSQGAILVYDITDEDSFKKVRWSPCAGLGGCATRAGRSDSAPITPRFVG